MRGWMGGAVLGAALMMGVAGARAGAPCALPALGMELSAMELADRAAACLRENRQDVAGKLFYAHRARVRALAEMGDPSWAASAQSVQTQIGAPANRWLGGDVPQWRAAIAWALDWDASAPWAQGAAEARARGVNEDQAREVSRDALRKLSADLARLDKNKFYAQRQKAGLAVRDPDLKPDPRR